MSNTRQISAMDYMNALREQISRQGAYPAGHYYSPIPSSGDVQAYIDSRPAPATGLPGINLNREGQSRLLAEYAAFYADLPFPETPNGVQRYHYENGWFNYPDAIFLHCFLRKHQPGRIVEVGSGFSSAVMLDTVDGGAAGRPSMTFIEPNPERLHALLRDADRSRVRIIESGIQTVPLDVTLSLEKGDLLFIDSSHVLKCASDLQFLLFEILPHIKPGVHVHFHDIFYPFEYPAKWLLEGRYWNEAYMLRAFLTHNTAWNIEFFNSYVQLVCADVLRDRMPLCLRDLGSSLYLQRA
jgi:predicted O-methyltransferase YrrM